MILGSFVPSQVLADVASFMDIEDAVKLSLASPRANTTVSSHRALARGTQKISVDWDWIGLSDNGLPRKNHYYYREQEGCRGLRLDENVELAQKQILCCLKTVSKVESFEWKDYDIDDQIANELCRIKIKETDKRDPIKIEHCRIIASIEKFTSLLARHPQKVRLFSVRATPALITKEMLSSLATAYNCIRPLYPNNGQISTTITDEFLKWPNFKKDNFSLRGFLNLHLKFPAILKLAKEIILDEGRSNNNCYYLTIPCLGVVGYQEMPAVLEYYQSRAWKKCSTILCNDYNSSYLEFGDIFSKFRNKNIEDESKFGLSLERDINGVVDNAVIPEQWVNGKTFEDFKELVEALDFNTPIESVLSNRIKLYDLRVTLWDNIGDKYFYIGAYILRGNSENEEGQKMEITKPYVDQSSTEVMLVKILKLMEAPRVKKAKPRTERTRPANDRPQIVNGLVLPAVPAHAPLQANTDMRTPSPEPEELVLSDDELQPTATVAELPPYTVEPSTSVPYPTEVEATKTATKVYDVEFAPASIVYPSVPSLSNDLLMEPVTHPYPMMQAGPIVKEKLYDPIESAPPIYPALSSLVFSKEKNGLFSEQELLAFYHNPLYESIDDFVDNFVQIEEFPSGPLINLLTRLKRVCDEISLADVREKQNNELLQKCVRECWISEQRTTEFKGKCGENKDGSGSVKYQTSVFSTQKLAELKRQLNSNRNILLDERLSLEANFRNLALQIQWIVISLNHQFMLEQNISVRSSPNLLESMPATDGRILLLRSLSDLFSSLRSPQLVKRFVDAVTGWIKELTCVLHMATRVEDSQFLLNHLLRLPSPISEWAAPLIQTFVQAPFAHKLKLDYNLTMLSHLMNPIRARESFLHLVDQSEKEDTAWAILGDEEEGDFSFVSIQEADLCALLDQLPISEIYSIAYLHFSSSSSDKGSEFVSILAFQLLLMKILDDGLSSYGGPRFRQFCKQIGNHIRQSVREFCNVWRTIQNFVSGPQSNQLQLEVDRVILLSAQYLVNRDSCGLLQFLVDLPYDCASEECRNRCDFLLRSPVKPSLKEVYGIPLTDIESKKVSIKERVESLDSQDRIFIVNALAYILSHSQRDPTAFLKEIIEVCFCDEIHRDSLYKVGSEAIETILNRRPMVFDSLLLILDRNIDHLESYAADVLSTSSISNCRISKSSLSVIGKWLVNKTPEEPANKLARRMLSGLNWGWSAGSEGLWISQDIHEACAMIVVKAHTAHCGRSNGMISKSIKNVMKIASKVPDYENLFSQFCWDTLIRLKLATKETSPKPENDLSAFFVYLNTYSSKSAKRFMENGLTQWTELVTSGSSIASIIILSKLIQSCYSEVDTLGSDKNFMDVFERLVHIDQCSYAVQWLTGPSSSATPAIKLICSSISYYSRQVVDVSAYLRAWTSLLCERRQHLWNNDQASLQILNTIVRIAFLKDAKGLLGLPEVIHATYMKMLTTWRESNKGFLSFLTADHSPPSLIEKTYFNVAPWATYLLLRVESKAFTQFQQFMYEALAKKDKTTLEQACKKASSKCSFHFAPGSLSLFKWASFLVTCDNPLLLSIIIQHLATEAYSLKPVNGQKYQFARRFIDSQTGKELLSSCRHFLESNNDMKGLPKAVSGWLFTSREITRTGFDFSGFDLDYLLQLILADDTNIWMDFVDLPTIHNVDENDFRLFSDTCQLGVIDSLASREMSPFRTVHNRAVPFPCLPTHTGLPAVPIVDANIALQQHNLLAKIEPVLGSLRKISEDFVSAEDNMTTEDEEYCSLLSKLYTSASKNLPVTIKCSDRCTQITNTQVTITLMEFSTGVDAQMTANRKKRIELWSSVFSALMDMTAFQCASLEHIARQLTQISRSYPASHRIGLQISGTSMFYRSTSSVTDTVLLCPVISSAFENTIRVLGQEFVRNRADEQAKVMDLVLNGFVLSEPLVESFTPEALSSTELCTAYRKLSAAIQNPERSSRALKLLGRLGIDQAAASLPPQQFSPLIPLAFENLVSQPNPAEPLHQLCLQHVITFVFHAFPHNFTAGLDEALKRCHSGAMPPSVFELFASKLDAVNFNTPKSLPYALPAIKCSESLALLARHLNEARVRLPAMYNLWGKYLDSLTRLSQLFIFNPVLTSFTPDSPKTVLQADLLTIFGFISSIWTPLLASSNPSVPPFSPNNEHEAVMVIDRLVELLTSLPHASALPPGTQNILSLVWQFYFEKLSTLTHGTTHYYSTIETPLMKLPWASFWPSQLGLHAMDTCLTVRSQDCIPFIAQLVVRIQWKNVLAEHVHPDNVQDYLAEMCSIFVRILSKRANYAKVSASLLDVLKFLSSRPDLDKFPTETVENLAKTVSVCLPFDSLASPTEHISLYQYIWRKVCCFVPKSACNAGTLLKQATWLQTECALLLRGGQGTAVPQYNRLIADVDTLAKNHENLRGFSVVTRELTTIWSKISDGKFGEALVNCWNAYIVANPQSPLVLCALNTIIGTLNKDQAPTALKVMERVINTYFLRVGANWTELMEWVVFPAQTQIAVQSYLLSTPTTENGVQPLFLCLQTFLNYGQHHGSVYFALQNYICSLKPKHVASDAAFIMVLQKFLQLVYDDCSRRPSTFAASDDCLHPFIRWLTKAAKDDSSFISNLISSKKTVHSPRMRAVLTVLELFLTQQSHGEGKKPRLSGDTPVINSRINAIKEAASVKAFVPFSEVFTVATSYFTQVDLHHLGSASQLLLKCSQKVYQDKFLSDL